MVESLRRHGLQKSRFRKGQDNRQADGHSAQGQDDLACVTAVRPQAAHGRGQPRLPEIGAHQDGVGRPDGRQ